MFKHLNPTRSLVKISATYCGPVLHSNTIYGAPENRYYCKIKKL